MLERATPSLLENHKKAVPTLDLSGAAALLFMHPEALRRKVRIGMIPAAKIGRRWIFIEADLLDYLRNSYQQTETIKCLSTSAEKSGGSVLPPPTDSEYLQALKLPTDRRPRNTTTA